MDTRPLNERCRQVTQLKKSGALDKALQLARLMERAPKLESRAQVKALIKMGEHPKTKKRSWRVVQWL